MIDPIRFHCRACGKKLKAPPDLAGRRVKCECGQSQTVPEPRPPASEGAILTTPPQTRETAAHGPLRPSEVAETVPPGIGTPIPTADAAWVDGKSTRTFLLWCAGNDVTYTKLANGETLMEFSEEASENLRRHMRGQSTFHQYRSHEVTLSYPPAPRRHFLKVNCPGCGKHARVAVRVLDEAARKREVKGCYLPISVIAVGLYWLAAWLVVENEPGAAGWICLVLIGLVVHLIPVACVLALRRSDSGLVGRVEGLLPADEHKKENGGNVGNHTISCVTGDTPDFFPPVADAKEEEDYGGARGEPIHFSINTEGGNFSVTLPQCEEQVVRVDTPFGAEEGHRYTSGNHRGTVLIGVVYIDFEVGTLETAGAGLKRHLDEVEAWLVGGMGGRVVSSATKRFRGEYPGRELAIALPDGRARARVLFADDRIYQILARGDEEFMASEGVAEMFDSFEIRK